MAHAGLGRDDAAIDPQSLGRIPFDDLAAAQDFEPGLIERLALLQRRRDRHHVDPLANEAGGLQDDLGPLGGRGVAPDAEPALGRGQRVVEIGRGGMRNRADHAFVGRVEHGMSARSLPAAVDVEFEFGIVHDGALLEGLSIRDMSENAEPLTSSREQAARNKSGDFTFVELYLFRYKASSTTLSQSIRELFANA